MTTICQIRSDVPDAIKGIEWVCFGSTTFSAWLPVYTNVPQMPDYLSNVTLDAETDNLYWGQPLWSAQLADKCYGLVHPECLGLSGHGEYPRQTDRP